MLVPLTVRSPTVNRLLEGLYSIPVSCKTVVAPALLAVNKSAWFASLLPDADVTVAALPSILPLIVLLNVFVPENVCVPDKCAVSESK